MTVSYSTPPNQRPCPACPERWWVPSSGRSLTRCWDPGTGGPRVWAGGLQHTATGQEAPSPPPLLLLLPRPHTPSAPRSQWLKVFAVKSGVWRVGGLVGLPACLSVHRARSLFHCVCVCVCFFSLFPFRDSQRENNNNNRTSIIFVTVV